MRVDWCVSSWFRIKNTHSLTRRGMGRRTGSPPARAGFWKDDQGDRWGSPAPDKGHDRLAARGTGDSQLHWRSQSSDLPPASENFWKGFEPADFSSLLPSSHHLRWSSFTILSHTSSSVRASRRAFARPPGQRPAREGQSASYSRPPIKHNVSEC